MNKHLNIYKTYSKLDRTGFQLEDDLTRALAIAIQENDVFSHQFIKVILKKKEKAYDNLFSDFTDKNPMEVDIQKRVESMEDFEHLFAVRISGDAMDIDSFFTQTHVRDYNPITDMYMHIGDFAIIFEVKPRDQNSTAQLYNQAFNAVKDREEEIQDLVTPVDFNWKEIMRIAVQVNNYQSAIGKPSRILDNFISYIKMHNYNWLPQLPLSALSLGNDASRVHKRLSDAIDNSIFEPINNRLGWKCNFPWAHEILLNTNDNGKVVFVIYPGNTRGQGWHIFNKDGEPQFKKHIKILGENREISKGYHVKFSGQSYITGLTFSDEHLKQPLYTRANFLNHTGRKKKGQQWIDIKSFLDHSFKESYDWKAISHWDSKIIESNRTQFNISFGYELSFEVDYSELQIIDQDENNLQPLIDVLASINEELKNVVL
jgi:hypothetical protein